MDAKGRVELFRILLVCILAVFILIIVAFRNAHAQERSGEVLQQLEKKDIVPKERPKEPEIKKEERPKEVKEPPKEDAAPKVLIKQFKVEGRTLLNPAIIHAIVSANENRELTFAEIQAVADLITAKYREAGYILANAFVPAQDVKDGVVVIKIIEGKVGKITVDGNKHYSKTFIEKHLASIMKDPSLKEQTLERSLLILNEYQSLEVKAALQAGKEPGTTDITATVADKFPISFSLGYDNFGSNTTSKHRMSAALNIGNLITSGDQIMLRGTTGLDTLDINKLSYGRIEYLTPIGYDGTQLGFYHANSLYKAGEELTILGIEGKARIYGLYISRPFIKTRQRTLSVKAGFQYKDVYEYRLDSLNSKDDIRIFHIGLNYDYADGLYGRNIWSIEYNMGIRDLLGGAGRNDTGTSRLNADGQFNKFNIDAARVQKLPLYGYLVLKGSAQLSADELFVAEQFTIGGMGSVRGFKSALHSGDNGYSLTAEFAFSPLFPETKVLGQKIGDTIKLALFADHGGVYRNKPQPGEDKDNFLTSLGAGLRLYAGKHLSFRIDYAVPEMKRKFNSKNSETYMQATVAF
jgi:hemolysin activation/secretion protein